MIKVISAPAGEQIDLPLARLHLRLDDDGDSPATHPDDTWLTTVGIPAAREYCEGWLGRALAPQTLELALDEFGAPIIDCCWPVESRRYCWRIPVYSRNEIVLPMAPLVSVDSIKYYDSTGALTTLSGSGYYVDDFGGRAVLVDGTSWPTTSVRPNAVRVRYSVGYSLPDDSPNPNPLPAALKAAMLLVLGALYENREDQSEAKLEQIPLGAISLMAPYRLRLGMA